MKVTAIIPARLQSTRLPNKVLADIAGQSMLQRVYTLANSTKLFDQVIIATDSELVMTHCISNNMRAVITSESHESGTDRIAEVAQMLDSDIVINIQADEPFLEKESLSALVDLMSNPEIIIGTLAKKIKTTEALLDYSNVKLITNKYNRVLYFSRQAIPAHRDIPYRQWIQKSEYLQHLGIYGFNRKVLLDITKLAVSNLESSEKLEQLRWLENGYDVHVAIVESSSFGIDTEHDLLKARNYVLKKEFQGS